MALLGKSIRWRLITALMASALALLFAANAGRFLVVDSPAPSDVILVLAGETHYRPERALQLLAQGLGRRIVLDVPASSTIYEFTQQELADKFIRDLPDPSSISVCPITGLSTRDEARDAEKCLGSNTRQKILIVTSDFHTRRALSIFRHELPSNEYTASASQDDRQFGIRWWTHRQWAKTFIDEWFRLLWWNGIDRWR